MLSQANHQPRVATRAPIEGSPPSLGRFDDLIRLGLAQVLKMDPAIDLVARDVEDGFLPSVLERHSPHVVVVDDRTAASGALSSWRAAAPAAGIVILGDAYSHYRTSQLMRAGATCVTIDATAAELIAVVRRVAAGERGTTPLTSREHEVLALVAAHYTHAEIAQTLHISIETARSHTANIRHKLGVRRNRELAAFRPAG